MPTLSIDMATPEGEALFQALAQARERYLVARQDAALATSARDMLDRARQRWMAEEDFDAFLASVPLPELTFAERLEKILDRAFEAERIAKIYTSPERRAALRRRLLEEARVFAYRWMVWTLYNVAYDQAELHDGSDLPDTISGAALDAIQAVRQSGSDPQEEMRTAHRHMFKSLMQNRKVFDGGSIGVVEDAAAKVFADFCPALAAELTQAFKQVMREADDAIHNYDGTLRTD